MILKRECLIKHLQKIEWRKTKKNMNTVLNLSNVVLWVDEQQNVF